MTVLDPTTIRLDPASERALGELRRVEGRSDAAIVRRALIYAAAALRTGRYEPGKVSMLVETWHTEAPKRR